MTEDLGASARKPGDERPEDDELDHTGEPEAIRDRAKRELAEDREERRQRANRAARLTREQLRANYERLAAEGVEGAAVRAAAYRAQDKQRR